MSRRQKLGMGMADLKQDISQSPTRPVYVPKKNFIERSLIWGRNTLIKMMIGAAVGGYFAYNYEHGNYLHVMTLGLAGGCLATDMDNNPRWDACTDRLVQLQMQAHDIELQEKITEAINDMNKPTKEASAKPNRGHK